MKTEPMVTIPMSRYNDLIRLEQEGNLRESRVDDVRARFERLYSDRMPIGAWVHEVLKQTQYLCQEFVPIGENSSAIALQMLSGISFNNGEREVWTREDWTKIEKLCMELGWSGKDG